MVGPLPISIFGQTGKIGSPARSYGEGSLSFHKKSGLYMARYTVETATGKERKALYAKTRSEAAQKLTEALANAQKGITADAGALTVGAFVERWLEDSVRSAVRQSTYQRDESLCRVHLVPGLGKKKLKTLNAAEVQRFYRAKLDSGLSSATVHKLHVVLHKALGDGAGLDPAFLEEGRSRSRPEGRSRPNPSPTGGAPAALRRENGKGDRAGSLPLRGHGA